MLLGVTMPNWLGLFAVAVTTVVVCSLLLGAAREFRHQRLATASKAG
jgi:predicted nucleic acid-binding protein